MVMDGRPKLSIIVPTKNSLLQVRALLQSIHCSTVASDVETIVVDSSSVDGTPALVTKLGARLLSCKGDRSCARNAGAQAARANALLFLDSDMTVSPTLLDECIHGIHEYDALCINEISITESYLQRARSIEKEAGFRSGLFEAARCIRAPVFIRAGGYRSSFTGLEDPDLHVRLLEQGARIGWIDAPVYHDERGLSLYKYLRKRWQYSAADRAYSKAHPLDWRLRTSLALRASALLDYSRKNGMRSTLPYYPGLAIVRFMEVCVRLMARFLRTHPEG